MELPDGPSRLVADLLDGHQVVTADDVDDGGDGAVVAHLLLPKVLDVEGAHRQGALDHVPAVAAVN